MQSNPGSKQLSALSQRWPVYPGGQKHLNPYGLDKSLVHVPQIQGFLIPHTSWTSQVLPENPVKQWHVKPWATEAHLPPFLPKIKNIKYKIKYIYI